ncbi:MAG: KOW domain-containing RNA-binding protein [Acutalibacteraceae bacterium]
MLRYGCLVLSLAGKDKGRLMAVVRDDEKGVWLADGKRRPLEHPKCKNRRHIAPTESVLDRASMTTDRALRRALRHAADTSDT